MNFNNNKQNGDMSDMFDDCVWARERERDSWKVAKSLATIVTLSYEVLHKL